MPPLRAGAARHHPRSEHGIGLAGEQRLQQVREALRRVLAVAMDQRHIVEPMLDGEVIADLLVAAVPLIVRIDQHVAGEGQRLGLLQLVRALERGIVRGIVNHQHLDVTQLLSCAGMRVSTACTVFSAL